ALSEDVVMSIIRCSALPMLFACAHSQDDSDMLIESYNGASNLGTAVHDAMRSIVAGGAVDVHLLALRHNVDEKDLEPLVWYGRKAWEDLAPSFPNPETEVEVRQEGVSVRLVGHVDLLSIVEGHARLIDWKSGRREESDYYPQLAGYATCLVLGRGAD